MRNIIGVEKAVIEGLSSAWYYLLALKEYRSVSKTTRNMRALNRLKKEVSGVSHIYKMVRVNRKYYWNMHLPGFPGSILNSYVVGELNRIEKVRSPASRLSILFLTITKKCQLACQHCYAWDEMDKKPDLPVERLKEIGQAFIKEGVSHIHLGGGEPMQRYNDMLELIRHLHQGAEIWMATNGFELTEQQAFELKQAGLKGVAISIDHYNPRLHNSFRGHPESFSRAIEATMNCQKAGLVTCWSVCVTKDFVSRENLFRYAEMARKHHVTWIQLFESMPSGRYAGKDVVLSQNEKKIIEDFYLEINNKPQYKKYPVVEYIGIYQKKIGCLGAGNRYVYVDTNGNLQPCPFCLCSEKIPVDTGDIKGCLEKVAKQGCKKVTAAW